MSDVIVKDHIYYFMRSSDVGVAQQSINTVDRSEVIDINSALYDLGNDYTTNKPDWVNTTTIVRSNSATWDNPSTNISGLSSYIEQKTTRVTLSSISNTFNFENSWSGNITTYTNTPNITAFITENINTDNYVTTIAQLSTGSIIFKISPGYTMGELISYGDLYETAGIGATANIIRVSNNKFLLTGLLQ